MKNDVKIKISKDFSETPGGRYENEGNYSGEEFRKKLLIPKYEEAKSENVKLVVDLDGCYGLPTSFLEEAFGGLVRNKKSIDIKKMLVIISNDRPDLENKVLGYINNAYDSLDR